MKTLLQLNTSLFAAGGQSSQLADKFVATWKANNADANVIVRDLASNPLPHLDAEHFLAYIAQPADRTARQQELAAAADALIDEIKSVDEESDIVDSAVGHAKAAWSAFAAETGSDDEPTFATLRVCALSRPIRHPKPPYRDPRQIREIHTLDPNKARSSDVMRAGRHGA